VPVRLWILEELSLILKEEFRGVRLTVFSIDDLLL
jgi:hypothetical protein